MKKAENMDKPLFSSEGTWWDGYDQGHQDATDEFVAMLKTKLAQLIAEKEKGKVCTNCVLDGTDACPRGAGRAVDDEICDEYIGEEQKNE